MELSDWHPEDGCGSPQPQSACRAEPSGPVSLDPDGEQVGLSHQPLWAGREPWTGIGAVATVQASRAWTHAGRPWLDPHLEGSPARAAGANTQNAPLRKQLSRKSSTANAHVPLKNSSGTLEKRTVTAESKCVLRMEQTRFQVQGGTKGGPKTHPLTSKRPGRK